MLQLELAIFTAASGIYPFLRTFFFACSLYMDTQAETEISNLKTNFVALLML